MNGHEETPADTARGDDSEQDQASASPDPGADTTRFEKAIAGRDSLVRALRDELQRVHEEKDELEGDLHEAEEELEQKTESEDYLTGKVGELLSASEAAEEKCRAAEARAEELQKELAAVRTRRDEAAAAAGQRDALASRIADLEAARDDLAQTLGASRAEKAELAKEIEALRSKAAATQKNAAHASEIADELDRLTAQRDELASTLAKAEQDRSSALERVVSLESAAEDLRVQLTAAQAAAAQTPPAESPQADQDARHSEGAAAAALEKEKLAARIAQLEEALRSASSEGSAGSARADHLDAAVARLQAERDEIAATLRTTDTERAAAWAERDQARTDLGRHVQEASQREQELLGHIATLQQTAAATDTASQAASDDEADAIRKRLSEAEDRASYLALKLASETEVRAVLEAQRSQWVGAADAVAANVRNELGPQLSAAREKLARVEALLAESERTCEKRLDEKHAAEQRALDVENSLIGTIETLKQRAAEAEKRATVAGMRVTEIEQRLAAESQRAKEASNELSRLREQSARTGTEARDTVDGLRKDIEALQGRAGQLEEQLRDAETERARLAEERNDLHGRLAEAEAREEQHRARLKDADDRRRVTMSEHGFLEKQIADLRREKDDVLKGQSAEAKRVEKAEKAIAQMEKKLEASVAKYEKDLVKQFDKGAKSQQAALKALEKEVRRLQSTLDKTAGVQKGAKKTEKKAKKT
jgi:chromosome segregation ATPase